ncbi:unnamed protein product [Pedinophyceae sp. YPF-701]|nr:unnamed protein product [Pedinophyceae sp. YPF-701]
MKKWKPPRMLNQPAGDGEGASVKRAAQPLDAKVTKIARRPLQPHAAPQVQAARPADSSKRCFRVLYTKRSSKLRRNKTFDDGILVVQDGTQCTLYDDSGKQVTRGRCAAAASLASDSELALGSWELEVDAALPVEDFMSGSCFLPGTTVSPGKSAGPSAAARAPPRVGASLLSAPPAKPSTALCPGRANAPRPPLHDANAPDAVVLNKAGYDSGRDRSAVVLDPFLVRKLRPHQKEGVQFLYECVMGVRAAHVTGAILGDAMGLGKTLQIISLVWTLLRQGPSGRPAIKKAVVVVPSSLVNNWRDEFRKWLGDTRLRTLTVTPGEDVAATVHDFRVSPIFPVLILSYEMARKLSGSLAGAASGPPVDLLVCDEGHRLKAAGGNQTIAALLSLGCKQRVVLTGTPLQNDLAELWAVVDFVNPGCLGTLRSFRDVFEKPITRGRERGCTPAEQGVAQERAAELARQLGVFFLQRGAEVNERFLPPLTSVVVVCRPTPLQVALYAALNRAGGPWRLDGGEVPATDVLEKLAVLKKICNHPGMLWTPGAGGAEGAGGDAAAAGDAGDAFDLRGCFPDDFQPDAPDGSSKMVFLSALLRELKGGSGQPESARADKVVVVSTSTKLLDVVQGLCGNLGLTTCRIDGGTDASIRKDIVDQFNTLSTARVCLLSSRAGGAGLNLIGANRLVLLDGDWNPAIDAQAMARVWRDGQRQPCTVMRLLVAGALDEKVYMRQQIKGQNTALEGCGGAGARRGGPRFTREELRGLFRLATNTDCETRDVLARGGAEAWVDRRGQTGDAVLDAAVASSEVVSFVHVDGRRGAGVEPEQRTLPEVFAAAVQGGSLGATERAGAATMKGVREWSDDEDEAVGARDGGRVSDGGVSVGGGSSVGWADLEDDDA